MTSRRAAGGTEAVPAVPGAQGRGGDTEPRRDSRDRQMLGDITGLIRASRRHLSPLSTMVPLSVTDAIDEYQTIVSRSPPREAPGSAVADTVLHQELETVLTRLYRDLAHEEGGVSRGEGVKTVAEMSGLPGPVMDLWMWQYDGACRSAEPSVFFHPDGERGSARRRRDEAAKAVCATCAVLVECREHALTAREPYGVWGGLTEEERVHALSERRVLTGQLSSTG